MLEFMCEENLWGFVIDVIDDEKIIIFFKDVKYYFTNLSLSIKKK